MSNLDKLEKEKSEMIQRHKRERQELDNEISKAKEHDKREKEYERKKKDLERQQNNPVGVNAENAYRDFIKDSMSITEMNDMIGEFLNQE